MSEEIVPSKVGFYHLDKDGWAPGAYFYLEADEAVRLEIVDPKWSGVAINRFENGIHFVVGKRVVTRDDGKEFMRALLEPIRASHYKFVNESRIEG